MWQCEKCREEVDEPFDACWNCGAARDGTPDPDFLQVNVTPPQPKKPNPLQCLRCREDLDFVGTRTSKEVPGLLDFARMFAWGTSFDIYVCPSCGRVELFIDGIGDDKRPE